MRLYTRKYNILQRLYRLTKEYANPVSTQTKIEYEEIDNLLMSAKKESKNRVQRLDMSDIQSYRKIKMVQIRLRLADQLVKRRAQTTESKLKQ